jgi:hypothetical protein
MPLAKGKGHKTISGNVAELIKAYRETGKIGNTTPKSLAHAKRIAVAIAYSTAGMQKGKHPAHRKTSMVSKRRK